MILVPFLLSYSKTQTELFVQTQVAKLENGVIDIPSNIKDFSFEMNKNYSWRATVVDNITFPSSCHAFFKTGINIFGFKLSGICDTWHDN